MPHGDATAPQHLPARDNFDVVQHHRDRTRKAEARADRYERLNAQLIRLLATILAEQFRDTHVDPLEYLQAQVDIDESLTALSYSFSERSAGSSELVGSRSKSRRPTLLRQYGSATNRSDRRTA